MAKAYTESMLNTIQGGPTQSAYTASSHACCDRYLALFKRAPVSRLHCTCDLHALGEALAGAKHFNTPSKHPSAGLQDYVAV